MHLPKETQAILDLCCLDPGLFYYVATHLKEGEETIVTLGLSQLYAAMLKVPFTMKAELGPHLFSAVTSMPVYLIDYEHKDLHSDYAIGQEELYLDEHKYIMYAQSFDVAVMNTPALKYKIERGNLYKYVHNKWMQINPFL